MVNSGAFGSCWLVTDIHFVNNADEEMEALDSINVRDTAIVENIFRIKYPIHAGERQYGFSIQTD